MRQNCMVHGADGSMGGCLMSNGDFAPSLPPVEVKYFSVEHSAAL